MSKRVKSRKKARNLQWAGIVLILLAFAFVLWSRFPDYFTPEPQNEPVEPIASTPDLTLVWEQWQNDFDPRLENTYYIRNLDDERKALCNGLYQGIASFQTEIILPKPVHKNMLGELMWLVKYDCPELFQISGECIYYVREDMPDMVLSVKPTYWMAQDLYESAIKEVDAVINRWLLSTEDLSEYETEKLIYERLMYGCTYLEEGPHTGTAYGALVLGQARCEGYSQALNLTLRRAGIDSLILTGEARTPATESSPEKVERHSWNAAKIGGSYYQLDATWDDPDDDNDELPIGSAYAYFNVTDAEMYKNRTLDQIFHTTIIPPACNDKTYNYFAMTDTYIPAGTRVQEALYSLLDRAVENGDTTSITGKLETDDQYETISENLRDWMHEWYKEKKYSSGTYNWAVYPDSRVFLITNLVYEK